MNTTRKPWPRTTATGAIVFKVFDADGRNMNQWLVSSASVPGAFRLVTFHMDRTVGAWWECGCPRGANIAAAGGKMGAGRPDRPCRHVLAVVDAEHDDGVPARPSVSPAIGALCD